MTTPTSAPASHPGPSSGSARALTKMTKVEVVVSGSDAPAVRELIKSVGATGFTSLSGVSGLGHSGYHQGRLLFNQQAALELIITVVPEDKTEALLAGLRPLLDASSGVMFVTETFVSRPEYFS
ncbi:P-II family nitrogen regulator [Mycolicibacterium sp.]|uniref:P-II family nitrogen regulator n=1 Tax=Mycolicibacterium sp. TaxID=2320850 RepID=UPI0028A89C0D|nr:transcriptional regulator [Mycolicibacterium sp.]